jgi:hypothetical protein
VKKVLLGALFTLVLVALSVLAREGYRAYRINQAVATYLFAETEVRANNGKPLSRAELLDLVLQDVVSRQTKPASK